MRRESILWVTQGNLAHLERERYLLLEAVTYLRIILEEIDKTEDLPPDIASQVYLVGEFSRRGEDYVRAWLYLAAAAQMDKSIQNPNTRRGLEIGAEDQLNDLRMYMQAAGIPPPTWGEGSEIPREEIAMVNRLVVRFRQMQAQSRE